MAAALRSFSTTTYASRTNCTVTAPSGITNDDILTLIFIHFNNSATPPTITLPTGFSSAIRSGFPKNYNNGSDYVHVWVSDKTASGESGDYTITHGTGTTQGMMLCVSGADTAAAKIDSWNTGASTTTTATTVTTNDDNSLVAFVDMNWQLFGGVSPPTGTTPTFTEQSDSATSLIYLATGVLATAGATGDKSHGNNNGSAFPWAGMLLAWDAFSGPTITDQPDSVAKFTGETAQFSVTATGTGTLTYQWQKDTGTGYGDIGSATSSTYTTPALGYTDDGDFFRCNVTDDNGTTASNGALLTVIGAANTGWFRA